MNQREDNDCHEHFDLETVPESPIIGILMSTDPHVSQDIHQSLSRDCGTGRHGTYVRVLAKQ